jgi:hypothetical protein
MPHFNVTSRKFSHVRRFVALAIVHCVDRRFGDCHFAEPGLRDVVDLEPVAEIS